MGGYNHDLEQLSTNQEHGVQKIGGCLDHEVTDYYQTHSKATP